MEQYAEEQKKRIRYMYTWMFRRYKANVITDSVSSSVRNDTITTDYLKMSQNKRMDKSIRFGWLGEAGSNITSGRVEKTYSLYPNYQIPRRNLLTYTEEFDNGVWAKNSCTVNSNSTNNPFGVLSADSIVESSNSVIVPGVYCGNSIISTTTIFSIYAKANTRGWIKLQTDKAPTTYSVWVNIINGTVGTIQYGNVFILDVGNGWYRISWLFNSTKNGNIAVYAADANEANVNGVSGTISTYIWGAQLEVGSVATDYQRVLEATNWDGSLKDATQTTPTSRPYITGNIAPNEKLGLKNPNGGSNFMTHPTISFAANESWSVTTVFKHNGFLPSDFHTHIIANGAYRISIRHNSNNLFSVVGVGGESDFTSSNFIIGKIAIITVTYSSGSLKFYVNNILVGSSSISISFNFSRIYPAEFSSYFNTYSHIIRSQALTQAQVTAEYTYLRSVYPEIESVVIGTQTWATSNCAVAASSNGTVIPDGTLTANWTAGTSYWCHHTNIDNGAIYDKLYNKAAKLVLAANPPEGWHYATQAELTTIAALGGNALKLIGNTYWTTANGTNATGLSLLGSGKRNADGSFNTIKSECYIWAADSDFVLKVTDAGVATIESANANDGYALRLVKNA